MLRNAAIRAIRPRAIRSSPINIRTYADKSRRPSRPLPFENSANGPVANRTWAPEHGIRFKSQKQSQDEISESDTPAEEIRSPASQNAKTTETGAAQRTTASATSESPAEQEVQQPSRPLPDLRQGIPSTFETEFSDKSSSFKDKDAESPNINITEDPTEEDYTSKGNRNTSRDAYTTSIERRRNEVARYMYLLAFGFFGASALWLGQKWENDDEARLHSDVPNSWSPSAMYGRIKVRLSQSLGYYTEPVFPKLLPDLDVSMRPPYTLVLSLEDLLVSSKWSRQDGWKVAKRPGVDQFLRYMSLYYELVIFTSVQAMNAELVIRKLDPYRIVMWPLFREATRYMNGNHVKDLSCLNRDLNKTLIIDTVPEHVQLQPENAIILPKWSGSKDDPHTNDLVAMIPFLEYIAAMSIEDVRKVIKSFEGTHIPTEFAAREARAREAFNKQLAEERARSGKLGSFSGRISGMLGFKPGQQLMQVPGEQSSAEAFAQGKMLSDQMRERGMRNYEILERDIRENGEKWLAEMQAEEKKMMDEQTKSMQSGVAGWPMKFFGGGSDGDGKPK